MPKPAVKCNTIIITSYCTITQEATTRLTQHTQTHYKLQQTLKDTTVIPNNYNTLTFRQAVTCTPHNITSGHILLPSTHCIELPSTHTHTHTYTL